MKIIVDTNIFIAALLKDSVIRKMILYSNFEFYTINSVLEEIFKYRDYIIEKSEKDNYYFVKILHLLLENVHIINDNLVDGKMEYAKSMMKDIDIKDSPLLAAALAIDCDGIWSDDKHLLMQGIVRVYTTEDISVLLGE